MYDHLLSCCHPRSDTARLISGYIRQLSRPKDPYIEIWVLLFERDTRCMTASRLAASHTVPQVGQLMFDAPVLHEFICQSQ